MASTNMNSETISQISQKEKEITGQDTQVKGGPAAQAQSHAGQPLSAQVIHDITEGEKKITGNDRPVAGGPTAAAQSILTSNGNTNNNSNTSNTNASGVLDSQTISNITAAEKDITGSENPAKGGPTAQAQKHAGEQITSQALHDITEGEKKITGGERVKGGPTAAAQSELGKARN